MIRQRIGIVLHDGGRGGGTERIARRLGQAWRREGREVVLLVGDPAGAETWNAAGNGPEARHPPLPLLSPARAIGRGAGALARLGAWAGARAVLEGLEGLYIPGNHHLPALPALRGAAGGRLALVARLSNPVRRPDRPEWRQRAWERLLARRLRHADAVVALSDGLAAQAAGLLPAARLHVVPNPILEDDTPIGAPPPAHAPPLVIGVGRLVAQKNWALPLDALALGAADVRLILVGDGPERATLEMRAAQLGLAGRVAFAGQVPDARPWMERARLLVLSSRFEGVPAVVVEALAAGLPVVATDCAPSIREMIPPGHGLVVPPDDPAALAEAMARMLAHPPPPLAPDALERYRIGPVGRRYLALFDAVP